MVLGVSIDKTGIDTVQDFMRELNLTFPTVHDQKGQSAVDYGARGVPMTFFIDVQGKAVGGVVGPREWDSQDFYDLVELLLAEGE